jgi:hypothetical protein
MTMPSPIGDGYSEEKSLSELGVDRMKKSIK